MSWYFSIALPAEPTGCHEAAESLRAVAHRARDAADFLDSQADLPTEVFSGLAAQSYRTAARALVTDCHGTVDDTIALAAALEDYAARISDVRRILLQVRNDALAANLEVSEDDLVQQVPVPRTEQDAIFRRLEAAAADAHAEADAAYVAWWQALQEHTKGPLPSRTGRSDELPDRTEYLGDRR